MLRLLFMTVAFSIGVDVNNIRRVIHIVFLTPLKNILKKLVDVDKMDFQHLPQYIITRMT